MSATAIKHQETTAGNTFVSNYPPISFRSAGGAAATALAALETLPARQHARFA